MFFTAIVLHERVSAWKLSCGDQLKNIMSCNFQQLWPVSLTGTKTDKIECNYLQNRHSTKFLRRIFSFTLTKKKKSYYKSFKAYTVNKSVKCEIYSFTKGSVHWIFIIRIHVIKKKDLARSLSLVFCLARFERPLQHFLGPCCIFLDSL